MEEILHQSKTVVYPMIYRVSTMLLVVQDFATIHRMYYWFKADPNGAVPTPKILLIPMVIIYI